MASNNIPAIRIENARLLFRNFQGKERKSPTTGKIVNREGQKNFCVVIEDQKKAQELLTDGWNIKKFESNDEYADPLYYIPVTVSFEHVPPKIYMITRKSKVKLDEDSVASLDYADIKTVDLSINPYFWEVNGKTGIKGYLDKAYITLEEDEWDEKYAGLESPEEVPFN